MFENKDLFRLQRFAEDAAQSSAEGTSGESAADAAQQAPDRAAAFEALITGEYKDLYDARVQEIVKKRLKGTEELRRNYNTLLEQQRGSTADDGGAAHGDVRTPTMNAQVVRDMALWAQQGRETKSLYPSFELRTELKNPTFAALLRHNVPIRTAYEVVHKDEILYGAMKYAAEKARQQAANDVMAGTRRPEENGGAGRSAAATKIDVAQLTRPQREDYIRRAQRGERITFR